MPCIVQIEKNINKKVEELSEEGLGKKLSIAKKIGDNINKSFGYKVVKFFQNADFVEREITIPKKMIQEYFNNEKLIEEEEASERSKEDLKYAEARVALEEKENLGEEVKYQLAKSELLQLKPISEQFDKDISEFNQFRLKDASGKYEEELKDSKFNKGFNFQLGKPSSILQSVGMPDLPITMSANWFSQHILDNPEHFVKTLNFKGLIEAIHNPIAIFQDKQYSGKDGRILILTELKGKNENNIKVIIQFNRSFGKLTINNLLSFR